MGVVEWYFAQARERPRNQSGTIEGKDNPEGISFTARIDGKVGQVARMVPCQPPLVMMTKGSQACSLLKRQGGPARTLTMLEGRSHARDGADRPFFLRQAPGIFVSYWTRYTVTRTSASSRRSSATEPT